jgi:putative membrane protein
MTQQAPPARSGPSRLQLLVFAFVMNAAAIWIAAAVLSGFDIGGILSVLGVAVLFALVNTLLKPVLHAVGCVLTIFSLGIVALVLNVVMLGLAILIGEEIGLEVEVDSFLDAVWAGLWISVISWLLNLFIGRPVKWSMRAHNGARS